MAISVNFLIFLVILVFSIFLRFYNLKNRGVLLWDEGVRLNNVLFLNDMINFLKRNFRKIINREVDLKEAVEKFRGTHVLGHTLSVFFNWLFGKIMKKFVIGALYSHAFFGILSIFGVFFLTKLVFGIKTALLATFIISISGYHLMYSRSIYPGTIFETFYIGATYFYILSLKSSEDLSMFYLTFCGILVGLTFLIYSRHFYIPLFFLFYELIVFLTEMSFVTVSRVVVLVTSMLLPQLLVESVYIILKEFGYPHPTYFRQLFYDSGNVSLPDLRFPFLRMHLENFYYLDGFIIIFTLLGSIFMVRSYYFTKQIIYLIFLTQFWVPFFIWSSRSHKIGREAIISVRLTGWANSPPRLMSSSLYSMAIISAIGLSVLPDKLLYFVIFLLIVSRIRVLKRIVKLRSGFKQAIEFILSQDKVGKHISFSPQISSFYVGKENVIYATSPLIDSIEDLYRSYKEGFRFLLYIKILHLNMLENKIPAPIDTVLNSLKPVYSVATGINNFKPLIRDDQNIRDVILVKENNIDIYDLKEFFRRNKFGYN